MAQQFEDILSILCSEVKLIHSNEFQKVFLLSTMIDAKLAFDVLVSYGFDVKIYHQDDDTSKLYVTHPSVSISDLKSSLDVAAAYANSLKKIKKALDELCATDLPALHGLSYALTFANSQTQGKQIAIQLLSDAPALPTQDTETLSKAPPASAAVSSHAVTSLSTAPKSYRPKPKSHYEELSSGPAVAREKYPGKLSSKGSAQENSWLRQQMLFLFGSSMLSGFAFFVMVVGLALIFGIFVSAKAFLCPDFGSMARSNSWYCKIVNPSAQQPTQK